MPCSTPVSLTIRKPSRRRMGLEDFEAAGLFAAIPALLAYNRYSQLLRVARAEMEEFNLEFLNLTERNFT